MINQRMCVACKTKKHKSELCRITSLNGEAVLDEQKKQTNRALYVCKTEHCIEILKKNNILKRVLKISANEEFYKNILK